MPTNATAAAVAGLVLTRSRPPNPPPPRKAIRYKIEYACKATAKAVAGLIKEQTAQPAWPRKGLPIKARRVFASETIIPHNTLLVCLLALVALHRPHAHFVCQPLHLPLGVAAGSLALRGVLPCDRNPAEGNRQKINLLVTQWSLQILKEERIPSSDLVLLFPNCEL